MHRTQIYLDKQIYKTLERESELFNLSISEIIRRSIRQQKNTEVSDIIKKMKDVFGIWKSRKIDSEKYIRNIRKDRKI